MSGGGGILSDTDGLGHAAWLHTAGQERAASHWALSEGIHPSLVSLDSPSRARLV